jgi:hypothetical protein
VKDADTCEVGHFLEEVVRRNLAVLLGLLSSNLLAKAIVVLQSIANRMDRRHVSCRERGMRCEEVPDAVPENGDVVALLVESFDARVKHPWIWGRIRHG